MYFLYLFFLYTNPLFNLLFNLGAKYKNNLIVILLFFNIKIGSLTIEDKVKNNSLINLLSLSDILKSEYHLVKLYNIFLDLYNN